METNGVKMIKLFFVSPGEKLDANLIKQGNNFVLKAKNEDLDYFKEIQEILKNLPKEEFKVASYSY